MWVWPLDWEDPLATHSSILAWKIPWRGAWWAIVHGVAKSWTWLGAHAHTHTHTHTHKILHSHKKSGGRLFSAWISWIKGISFKSLRISLAFLLMFPSCLLQFQLLYPNSRQEEGGRRMDWLWLPFYSRKLKTSPEASRQLSSYMVLWSPQVSERVEEWRTMS